MTDIQFFAVIAKMRAAQRKYYSLQATHTDKQYWLKESKRLEKIVDAEIARRLKMIDVPLLKEAYLLYSKDYTPQMKLDI